MPWCEECAKFWNPSSMRSDGSCPTCGRHLASPPPVPAAQADGPPGLAPREADDYITLADDDDVKTPWHFKLLVVAIIVYLGWRAVQMVSWVI